MRVSDRPKIGRTALGLLLIALAGALKAFSGFADTPTLILIGAGLAFIDLSLLRDMVRLGRSARK